MNFSSTENIESNKQSILQAYQTQIETCCVQLLQNLESSYNRIDDFLDQIIDESQDLFNQRLEKQQQLRDCSQNSSLPYLSSIQINNQQFSNELIHQVTSLTKVSIDKQVKKKDEYVNQLLKIQDNQYQQSQSKNSDIQLLQQLQETQTLEQQSPFNYRLINNNSYKQNELCCAIAMNKDCSIVIAGCSTKIKVFEFKLEKLIQTQLLIEHRNRVTTLNFMKRSNQFISGSDDAQIIIWQMNQSNQWVCLEKLNGHNGYILCLVLNNNEDLIISGSYDIKFWIKQNEWLCQQTITDPTNYVTGLSLNQEQNKVISCGYDAQILIIEQSQQNSRWIVIQKIKVQQYGCRICFINDNLFTFQPQKGEQMHVYEMNNTNKQYSKTKHILVKGRNDGYWFFPQQFIKQKCLLVNKNSNYVNLIRTKENGEFEIQQSIEYKTDCLFGSMSDDGQYLIIWDYSAKEFQIRKYHQI